MNVINGFVQQKENLCDRKKIFAAEDTGKIQHLREEHDVASVVGWAWRCVRPQLAARSAAHRHCYTYAWEAGVLWHLRGSLLGSSYGLSVDHLEKDLGRRSTLQGVGQPQEVGPSTSQPLTLFLSYPPMSLPSAPSRGRKGDGPA